MTRVLALVAAVLAACSCQNIEQAAGVSLGPRKAIAELKYAGDRPDAPPLEERGNSVFTNAAYDETGSILITQPWFGTSRIQVWDTKTGSIISGFDGIIPSPGSRHIWNIDSARRRLFARTGKDDAFALFDLMTGETISVIDDTDDGAGGKTKPPSPFNGPYSVGFTHDATQVMIFKPGVIELWGVDPVRMAKRVPSPFTEQRFAPVAVGGTPGSTYTDKHSWEWSHDHRTLAVAYTPEEPINAYTQYFLIDAGTLDVARLRLPEPEALNTFGALEFSPDGRWLAVGHHEGMLIYDLKKKEWVHRIRGAQHRSDALAPMRFTADGTRVIALGDQLQVSVYDVETGSLLGRLDTLPENWEGQIKISADGSRVVIYRFLSDTFEVLDGNDARRIGWVCPYFCNVLHNPLQPGYAVSPDGKSAAISIRRGAAEWDTATDTIKFPLKDPKRKPLPYPMQQR